MPSPCPIAKGEKNVLFIGNMILQAQELAFFPIPEKIHDTEGKQNPRLSSGVLASFQHPIPSELLPSIARVRFG
jgi:hypothetical protein